MTGLDFSEPMLERARRKAPELEWVRGDALALPFADESFDAATVGFGIRNVADLEAGLRELARVLRPGGRLAILEITRPKACCGRSSACGSTSSSLWPARSCPGARPTRTCPPACGGFPGPEDLARALEGSGFGAVSYRLLAGGIVALHVGEKT